MPSVQGIRIRLLTVGVALSAALGCGSSEDSGERSEGPGGAAGSTTQEVPGQPPRGQWYRARRSSMTESQIANADALEGIGYASGMESAKGRDTGVHHVADTLLQPGLSFYTSGHGPEAFLMDTRGEVVHRWRAEMKTIWPERDMPFGFYRKARLFDGGVILAIVEGRGLVALDKDSKVLWTHDQPTHHDVGQGPDGGFFALDREARLVPELHEERLVLDDGIIFFTGDGEVRGRVSLIDALLSSEHADAVKERIAARIEEGLRQEEQVLRDYKDKLDADPSLRDKIDYVGDILHTNSVRRIDAETAAAIDGFEEGWYLVSIRDLSLLACIEVDEGRGSGTARWIMAGEWRRQHEAVPLPSGRIMMFDNLGVELKGNGKRARVIEIDPKTGEIQRSIDEALGERFNSPVGGSCQRLANGNTLITESTSGSAFEITDSGELAWSFSNPHRAGEDEDLIAFLPDVIRMPEEPIRRWLPRRQR